MLTAEIKVNGSLIGHLYIVNEQSIAYDGDECQYRYEHYHPDEPIKKGGVIHNRSDGALELIKKVIEDIEEIKVPASILKERIQKACDVAFNYGGCDGNHHKMWVIDQMVRALSGDEYQDWVNKYQEGDEYKWDEGIAP